jgi:hypothetical protein
MKSVVTHDIDLFQRLFDDANRLSKIGFLDNKGRSETDAVRDGDQGYQRIIPVESEYQQDPHMLT